MTGTRIGSAGLTDDNFNTLGIFEEDIHPDGYCGNKDGFKTPPHSQAITNGGALNGPMMQQWTGTNMKENTVDMEERHFIYEDGIRYPEDDIEFDEKTVICEDIYIFIPVNTNKT